MPDYTRETWLPVVGYEGIYEVSDHGRVRSLERRASDGRRVKARILRYDTSDPRGYLRVGLVSAKGGKQRKHLVHALVLTAFIGPRPEGLQCRHLNGKPSDCSVGNLAWGTVGENALDRVRHGTWVNNNRFVKATHCVNGHEFDPFNTYWRPTGGRACKSCARDRAREYRRKAAA